MAEVSTTDATPTVSSSGGATTSFFKRELNGATFLTLEHVGHMVLTVVIAVLLVVGITDALLMWTGGGSASMFTAMSSASLLSLVAGSKALLAYEAVGVVAALLVLVPVYVVLDRRTRAEWLKRTGYASRLAYKVPVYTALGVLVAAKLAAWVAMVNVVVSSLVMIGVSGSDIGGMYLNQFLPAAIAAVVFGAAAWYAFRLAKGRDLGKIFSAVTVLASTALVVALLITSVVVLHDNSSSSSFPGMYSSPNSSSGSGSNFENWFNY